MGVDGQIQQIGGEIHGQPPDGFFTDDIFVGHGESLSQRILLGMARRAPVVIQFEIFG